MTGAVWYQLQIRPVGKASERHLGLPVAMLSAELRLDSGLLEHRLQLDEVVSGDRNMVDPQIGPASRDSQREQYATMYHIFVLITSINSLTAAVLLASIAFSSSFNWIS